MNLAMRLAMQTAGRSNGAVNMTAANVNSLSARRLPVSPVMAPGMAPR